MSRAVSWPMFLGGCGPIQLVTACRMTPMRLPNLLLLPPASWLHSQRAFSLRISSIIICNFLRANPAAASRISKRLTAEIFLHRRSELCAAWSNMARAGVRCSTECLARQVGRSLDLRVMQNLPIKKVNTMTGTEFIPTSSDAGASLHQAWIGIRPVSMTVGSSTRRHSTIRSCTADVRRSLYAAGRPLTLAELHDATGYQRATIGSILIKMQVLGDARKIPVDVGRITGASYLWTGREEPGMRRARVNPGRIF